MDPTFLVYPGVALIFGMALLQANRKSARRIAGLTDLAHRLGLTLQVGRTRLGAMSEVSLHAPEDGLRVALRFGGTGKGQGHTLPGALVLTLPEPRLAGGLAVFACEQAEGMARANATLAGALDNPLAKRLMRQWIGAAIGDHLGEVRDFPSDRAPGLMILGTVDPAPFYDVERIAAALASLPQGLRGHHPPRLLVAETGLMLVFQTLITAPSSLEGIVGTFRDLARDLRVTQGR